MLVPTPHILTLIGNQADFRITEPPASSSRLFQLRISTATLDHPISTPSYHQLRPSHNQTSPTSTLP